MSGRNRLTILVDAKNQASGQIRSVGSDISSISQSIEGAFSLEGALGGLGQLSPMLGSIATAAAGVGVAVGGWKLAEGVFELGKLGAQSGRVRDGFDELAREAGTSGQALLGTLRDVSQGAINNQELMTSANRSMMLGVADSADEMSALMAVAIDRGRKLGTDAQTAFNDLVTGLGRASPQILDNLAIMVDSEQVFGSYAASIGKSADALSEAEKKQALVNTVVAEGRQLMSEQGATTADAAASFERMDAAISNSKAALGELFAPAVAVVAENIARAAELATTAVEGIGDGLDVNNALGNITAIELALRGIKSDLDFKRGSLSEFDPGSDVYVATLREIGQLELLATTRTRDLQAVKEAYFATLQRVYPAQQQYNEAMIPTSVTAIALAQAQTQVNAAMVGQVSAASSATASMDLLGASYDLLVQRASTLESTQGQLASIASQMTASLGEAGAVDLYAQMNAELEAQIANWQQVGYSQAAIQNILLPAYIAQLRDATVGTLNLTEGSRAAATELSRVQATALGAASGVNQTAGAMNFAASAANVMAAQVAQAAAQLDRFAASAAAGLASDLVASKGAGAAVAYYNAVNGQIGRQTDLWKEQGYTIEQIEGVLLPGYVAGLRKANTATLGLGSATRGVGSAVAKINQEFSDLQSKVSGVVSGGLGDIGGINLDDLLPRQDSVSEDARRLADVAVNGFKSPWAAYFQSEFPQLFSELTAGGDIQGAAAQMLKDFQDGLRPELIDKDRAKEIVKRAIVGDKNTKALVDEISKDLASELGISIQEAQKAAQGALGGGGLLGGVTGAGGGAGALAIKPTLDTSALTAAPVSITATIFELRLSDDAVLPQIGLKDATIFELRLSDDAELPQIGLKDVTIFELQLSDDAELPEVRLSGVLGSMTVDPAVRTFASESALAMTGVVTAIQVAVDAGTAVTEQPISMTGLVQAIQVDAAAKTTVTESPVSMTGLIGAVTVDPATRTAINESPLTMTGVVMSVSVAADVRTFVSESALSMTGVVTAVQLGEGVQPTVEPLLVLPTETADAARLALAGAITPTVVPVIDVSSDSALASTLVAGSNLAMGIMEAVKAYDLPGAIAYELSAGTGMYAAGGTNGQLYANGFMDFFGGNVPAHVVNVLFSLVWNKIQAEQGRKAAR